MQTRLQDILAESDRQGERQIALFQALLAMISLLFLVFDSAASVPGNHAAPSAAIAGMVLFSSLLRTRLSRKINLHNLKLHLLTVTDGTLIFSLVISFAVVRGLPLETTFTTPAIVFLVVYTGIRVLRFDPMAVAVAGLTALAGWCALVAAAAASGAPVSGPVQMGAGFAAMLLALVVAMAKARKVLANAAHLNELENANRIAEAHVAQHEELLRSSIDAILIVAENGSIERANPALQALFGYSETELVGRSAAMLMAPRHAAALTAGLSEYLAKGSSALVGRSLECEGMDRNGESIAVDVSISPFSCGGKQRFAAFIRDARSRKGYERQLTAEKERAEFANRAKAGFLAMMSHEVRTPLHGLLGILEMLAPERDERERAELIAVARNSGQALLQIINDILDFSKLDEGKLSIVNTPFETAKLIEGAVALLHPLAAEKGLLLSSHADGPLPRLLNGDAGRIRQILLNLATNAIKFTGHGSVTLCVTNCGTEDAPRMRFAVADTGKGIESSVRHLVFREFETLGAPDHTRQTGTGLGLAISKRLVEAMGGQIGFESVPGEGSNFWFELPMKAAEERRIAPRDTGEQPPAADLSGLRVLAVEDNLTNQFLLRRNLEVLGVEVEIAGDGEGALELLQSRQFDAVLMDISMPGMDGLTATSAIRAKGDSFARLPVIMMSAYAFPEDRERAMAAGATGYLPKPVARADLVHALSRHVPAAGKPAAVMLATCGAADLAAMERATQGLKEVAGVVGAHAIERLAAHIEEIMRSAGTSASAEKFERLQARSTELLKAVAENHGIGGDSAGERLAR